MPKAVVKAHNVAPLQAIVPSALAAALVAAVAVAAAAAAAAAVKATVLLHSERMQQPGQAVRSATVGGRR